MRKEKCEFYKTVIKHDDYNVQTADLTLIGIYDATVTTYSPNRTHDIRYVDATHQFIVPSDLVLNVGDVVKTYDTFRVLYDMGFGSRYRIYLGVKI